MPPHLPDVRIPLLTKPLRFASLGSRRYYRTAFEDKKNGDYRASLDMNVTLIAEREQGGSWVRQPEAANDAFLFPFAVLELKINTHALESSADVTQAWIRELVDVGGAIEVNKVSACKLARWLTSGRFRGAPPPPPYLSRANPPPPSCPSSAST
jgi:hypothetical protein